jgi:hypothetical protein
MDWADLLKTLITAVTSVIVALVTAGYFRKTQDKKKEKKSREKLVEQIQRDEWWNVLYSNTNAKSVCNI